MECEKYPKNEMDFEKMFPDEECCVNYLFEQRWPKGFVCPKCKNHGHWELQGYVFECSNCHTQTSITAGTVMHKTRKPLKMWFKAFWWYSNNKTGISALELKRLLGLNSYQTAWSWLQKIRSNSIRIDREKLSGNVEIDETFIGGRDIGGKRGRGSKKVAVAVAVEKIGRKTGRIRLSVMDDCSGDCIQSFVKENVLYGSNVITDGWPSYEKLSTQGYTHSPRKIKKNKKDAASLLPGVHIVASLIKRFLLGTYQAKFARKHLQKYLDEYCFRYNRRTSKWIGKKFMRIVQMAAQQQALTYQQIIA